MRTTLILGTLLVLIPAVPARAQAAVPIPRPQTPVPIPGAQAPVPVPGPEAPAAIPRAQAPAPIAPDEAPAAIQRYLNRRGFKWKCERRSGFQFCWEASLDQDPNMRAAREGSGAARDVVLRAAGTPVYSHLIYVFFVASPDRMYQLIGYRGEGRSRPVQHAIFFVPTPIRPDLTHELCHEILTNVWGVAEAWIEEGFASLLAEGEAVMEINCRSMQIQHTLLPLAELVRPEWDPSKHPIEITYRELGGFVAFLRERYGPDRVKQIWQQGSASIPSVTGKPLADLEREWLLELDRANASHPAPRR